MDILINSLIDEGNYDILSDPKICARWDYAIGVGSKRLNEDNYYKILKPLYDRLSNRFG